MVAASVTVEQVYTAAVRVRHDDLDALGRAHPSACLRWLAQVAIDASAAVGFDGAWYDAAGARWLVRRTTFDVLRPARASETLAVRSWVEDFRRVRSRRRYEAALVDGTPAFVAVTDWVFVDLATGRPRRIPADLEARFGVPASPSVPRAAWDAPVAPVGASRSMHRVRWTEVDALGHMNNAVYLDVLLQGALDALEALGWPVAQLASDGAAPYVAFGDVEYLDEVRYGDQLETRTWFTPARDALGVHQQAVRSGDGRPVVRANTRWRWVVAATDAPVPVPAGLAAAVGAVRAA